MKNAGKFDAAYDAFNHCLAIDSTAAPVLYELSSFYVQLNRPEKAVEMLKRAVANSTDDAVVLDNSHMTVEEQMTWFMERFDRIACGR